MREEVVRNADIAMYRAKSRGKAGYVVFDEAMHAERGDPVAARDRPAAGDGTQENSSSITSRSCRSGPARSASFEALLRWYHPDRGLVCPDDFIPLAEETKLILPIGLWVIRTAAEQLRSWQGQLWMIRPLSISVNLSCRQFFQPDLVYQIERVLLETGLDARCLKMEITESAIMEQVETASSATHKAQSARGQARHRRFRQGLFVAQLPPSVPL